MGKKQMLFTPKGMNKDLSVSKFNPEFTFENRNLRLSTNEGNTLMSWVNEKGTSIITLQTEGEWKEGESSRKLISLIKGTPIGTAVINERLVLFTHEDSSDNYVVDSDRCDHIYLLRYANTVKTLMQGIELFEGNLNFNTFYPLETLTSYESLGIQKVYWTDGYNQPRLINVADLNRAYQRNNLPINSSFDFVSELSLKENVSILKVFNSSGEFPAGVIQYAFTYYNLHGLETNIFYTTPLHYISHYNRGGAPGEKLSNAFKISLENLDTNFDYVRIYSIIRTSLNAIPIVRRVLDIKISDLINEVGGINIGDLDGVNIYLYSIGDGESTSDLIGTFNIKSASFSDDENPTDESFKDIDSFILYIEAKGIETPRHALPLVRCASHLGAETKYDRSTLPDTMTIDTDWEDTMYEDELDLLDKIEKEKSSNDTTTRNGINNSVNNSNNIFISQGEEELYTVLNYRNYSKCYVPDNDESPTKYYFCNVDYNDNTNKWEYRYNLFGNVEIPKSITVNGTKYDVVGLLDNAFYKCVGIRKIRLSDNIESIGTSTGKVFCGCTNLVEINLPGNIKYNTIWEDTFRECSSLKSIIIPNNITAIRAGAFQETGLEKLEIPASIISIGNNAFYGCSNLSSVEFKDSPDPVSIENNSFTGCTAIKVLKFNRSKIDNWFSDSKASLETLVLGEYVEVINGNPFVGCTVLKEATLEYNNNLHTIYSNIFDECSSLTSLSLDKNIGNSTLISGIPKGVFYNTNIKHLILGDHVTSIGDHAFDNSELQDIEMGSGSISIGEDAFVNSSILSLAIYSEIPPTVVNANDPFSGNTLQKIYILNDYANDYYTHTYWSTYSTKFIEINERRTIIANIYYALDSSHKTAKVTAGPPRVTSTIEEESKPWYEGEIVIPKTVYYRGYEYTVTGIESRAFQGCKELKSISLPISISPSSIGADAFYGCVSLDKVILNNGSFMSEDKTASTSLSAIFGSYVSVYDISNTDNEGASITHIGDYTFYNCIGLTSFIIPNTITSIGISAFEGCSYLGTESLEVIDSVAILIRNNVTTIGSRAFKNCIGISQVILGENVLAIGAEAFSGCTNLLEVMAKMSEEKVPIIDSSVFENYNSNGCILRVYPSYLNIYKNRGWNDSVFTEVTGFKDPRFADGAQYYYVFKKSLLKNLIIRYGNNYYSWVNKPEELDVQNEEVLAYYFPLLSTFTSNTDGGKYLGDFMVWEKKIGEDNAVRFNARKIERSVILEDATYEAIKLQSTPKKFSDTFIDEYNGELTFSSDGRNFVSMATATETPYGFLEKLIESRSGKEYYSLEGLSATIIYLKKGGYCYRWSKTYKEEDKNKKLYILFFSSYSIEYYRIPDIKLETGDLLDLFILPHGYYTSNLESSYTRESKVILQLKRHRISEDTYDLKPIERLRIGYKNGAHYFIDTNTSGELVDPTHLLYLGGDSIVAKTIMDKDGTLFLGNLSIVRPIIPDDIKNLILKDNKVLNSNGESSKTFPCADANISCSKEERYYVLEKESYIHTLSSPEGIAYGGASAFKVNEYYRLGVQFQYKTGKWSEPCWIGDKQWSSTVPDGDNYGPRINESGLDAKSGGAGVLALPEFNYTISKDIQNSLYNLGYRRIRAVYVQPRLNDRTILCQGVACPTMYRYNDRGLKDDKLGIDITGSGIYALSSWLFRAKFTPTNDPNAEYYGYRNTKNLGGAVEYKSMWLPTYWMNTLGPHDYEIPSTNAVTGEERCYDNIKGVWMPFYRSTEIMGIYERDDTYYIDNKFITLHTPDVEFDNNISSSYIKGANLCMVGFTKLETTWGDIDILTSTPTIGGGNGFIHTAIKTSGTSALISGNFYEDHIVWSERDSDNGNQPVYKALYKEDKKACAPVLWPVHMWHRKGSLNNDVNRENASSKLLKKRISNFRRAGEPYYTRSIRLNFDIPYDDVLIFNGTESSHIIKLGGKVYQGCVDTMLTPSLPSSYYFIGEPLGNKTIKPNRNPKIEYVPITKTFLYDVYNANTNNYVFALCYKNTDENTVFSYDVPKTEDVHYPRNDDETWAKVEGDYTLSTYDNIGWMSLGNNYDNLGDTTLGLTYFRDGVPIKYKSTPHIVIGGFDEDLEHIWCYPENRNSSLANHPDGAIIIFELRRDYDKNIMFGGTSEDAFKDATWIPCGSVVNINPDKDTKVRFLWGDTYFQRYECLKTYAYTPEDLNQVVEIGSFVLETRVNIDGRYDRNRAQISNLNASPQNFNLINPVYSLLDNFFNYKIMAEEYYKDINYPNLITWTKTKTSGADVDLWTNVTLASILEMDGSIGGINKLVRFNDLLIAFLDKGIALILYNENTQISTTEGVPIEIANSGKVLGKRYITNTIGCSNKWSITRTANGIYFIDSNDKSIYLFSGELSNISTTMGFNSWTKNNIPSPSFKWNPSYFENFVTYYDRLNQEVLFINKDETLAFSEKFNVFTSFYDYGGVPYFCNFEDTSIWIDNEGNLWKHLAGNYCNFFGVNKPYSMTLIGNPEPQVDKIFTNLEFRANTEGDTLIPFDYLEVWNEYLHGIANLSAKDGIGAMQHDLKDMSASLNRKFRIWRCDIPRDNAPVNPNIEYFMGVTRKDGKAHPNNRIRNPWAYIKLEKNASHTSELNLSRCEIHDIVMTYYN